ncbi:hypothetical protein [Haloarcula amylolytica]|uniref:hypothetical protein n=1 Tax=Haloarcula amylolytica TaxID=396317 RepID=UPI003C785C92
MAPLFVFIVALLARTAYWIYGGTAVGADTNGYLRACEVLATEGPVAFVFGHKGILYSGFTVPLCSVLSIPGATFDLWVIVQILLASLGSVLIYKIGTELVDRPAGVLSGLAMAVLWDTFQWDVYVLSDSLFTFGMVLVLGALAWHHREETTASRVAVFATMGYLLVSRPHGFPIVMGWVLYDLFPKGDKRRLGLFSTRWIPLLGGASLVAAIPYAVQRYYLLDVWESGELIIYESGYAYPYVSEATGGIVGFVLSNLHHLLVMGILKTGLFFIPALPRHSAVHIAVNLVTYLPITAVGFVGLAQAWKNDFRLFRMWASPVIVLAGVTAVTFVSWDLRYRAPLGPVFALAFGYAVTTTLPLGDTDD